MRFLVSIFLLFPLCLWAERTDSILLPEVEVSETRSAGAVQRMQEQVTVVSPIQLERLQIQAPKDLTRLVPNVLMPDYGSAMTSSIYMRGLGSRMDQPVLGIVVDGVPLLDKNGYDFQLQGIRRMELLRGPQGTLYGRNTMGGLLDIQTFQPLDFTAFRLDLELGYGTANQAAGKLALYHPVSTRWGWSLSGRYRRNDGFYRNQYDGKLLDGGQQAGGQFSLDFKPNAYWRVTNTVTADWVNQGAFPYASVQTDEIRYNDEGSYSRLCLREALRAGWKKDDWHLQLSGSYQYLDDRMRMDQDYTERDLFTLEQRQRIHGGTVDALLERRETSWYRWTLGYSGFVKRNNQQAPVTFQKEGIDSLILANANQGMQRSGMQMESSDQCMPIRDDFVLWNWGSALYHQSQVRLRHWQFTLGLRLDMEQVRMDYDAGTELHYSLWRQGTRIQDGGVVTQVQGERKKTYWQVMPRLAVSYICSNNTVYAYVAKGTKAGGYNTQIMSTVVQNQLMYDMSNGRTDSRYRDVGITEYKPEIAWTYELGDHWKPCEDLQVDADVFYIHCKDQQVTVFPDGNTTGRMMANAARARSLGGEVCVNYHWQQGKWSGQLMGNYGYTDARFTSFDDGRGCYDGNHVPYAPEHTLHGMMNAQYAVGKIWLQRLGLTVQGDGIGRIWWNETNSLKQGLYGLLNAEITLAWPHVELQVWGRNLTGTRYNVFYFESMEKEFLQKGKPLEVGVSLKVNV